MNADSVTKLFPHFEPDAPLQNLYRDLPLPNRVAGKPYIYANYICSMDGRIALPHPHTGTSRVPDSIANAPDWRLFQELAAQADVLLTTGRYLRDLAQGHAQAEFPIGPEDTFQDLIDWRLARGLARQPDIAILSNSLEFDTATLALPDRRVHLFTQSSDEHRLAELRAKQIEIHAVDSNHHSYGQWIKSTLFQENYQLIYSIGGTKQLEILLETLALDCLFLTQRLQLLGGTPFTPLVTSANPLQNSELSLHHLYHHKLAPGTAEQLFACYTPSNSCQT